MPSVTAKERAGISDFKRIMAEKNEAPRAPQQPTRRSHIAEFSAKLEAKQQAPTAPNEPRDRPGEKPENMGDPNQLKEPGNLEVDPEAPPAEGEVPEEQEAAPPDALDDLSAIQKFREWEQGDMFPEELEGKLHELKANGQVRYVDTKELKQGYIRGVDYRRFHTEAQQVSQRAEQREQAMQQHFEAIRDPEQMLEIFERQGYGETLEKVAYKLAERIRDDRAVVNAAMRAAMERLGTNDPNHRDVAAVAERTLAALKRTREVENRERRLAFEQSQLENTKKQAQSTQNQKEYHALYENQLNQLRPNAFKAYGIKDTVANRQALARHLGNVISSKGFTGNITRDLVMEAASDLNEERADTLQREQSLGGAMSPQQWQAQRAQGQALPPNRLAVGGGKPNGNTAGKTRGSVRDLEAMIAKGRSQ
jgi:hypothetical protein